MNQQSGAYDDTICSSVPDEFICHITLEIMSNPVMTRWGNSFEREAILQWLSSHGQCPLTRNPMSLKDIIVNKVLREKINQWKSCIGVKEESQSTGVLPLIINFGSSKKIFKALEDRTDTAGKLALRMMKANRKEIRRQRNATAARSA